MEKKKTDNPTKKLETQFLAFQKEWKKFLENDFSHLVSKVDTLVEQNGVIQQNMGTMEQNILRALGAQAYNWVNKEDPQKGK